MESEAFLYEVKSFRECFGEEVRYIVYPHGKEQAVDFRGLTWKYNTDNHCESIYCHQGKYFRSEVKAWIDMDPDVYPKVLENDGSDVELTAEDGPKALAEFKEKQKGLMEITKDQLILYLMGDQLFARSIGL